MWISYEKKSFPLAQVTTIFLVAIVHKEAILLRLCIYCIKQTSTALMGIFKEIKMQIANLKSDPYQVMNRQM